MYVLNALTFYVISVFCGYFHVNGGAGKITLFFMTILIVDSSDFFNSYTFVFEYIIYVSFSYVIYITFSVVFFFEINGNLKKKYIFTTDVCIYDVFFWL